MNEMGPLRDYIHVAVFFYQRMSRLIWLDQTKTICATKALQLFE